MPLGLVRLSVLGALNTSGSGWLLVRMEKSSRPASAPSGVVQATSLKLRLHLSARSAQAVWKRCLDERARMIERDRALIPLIALRAPGELICLFKTSQARYS
jgi:hypothetical protein